MKVIIILVLAMLFYAPAYAVDYENVDIAKLEERPDNGDIQNDLGDIHWKGIVVSPNYDMALMWYTKAAKKGHAKAQFSLAEMYFSAKDYNKAIKWLKTSAEKGFIEAQNDLGGMYLEGIMVPQDYNKAIEWLEKAARQGSTIAQYNLGEIYLEGNGISKDSIKAYAWLNLAASNGDENAAEGRRLLATEMTPSQIEEAEALEYQKKYSVR